MRHYDVDGVKLPSVTTILGAMLAKPQLVPWAAKKTATAFKQLVSKNMDILTEDMLDDFETIAKKAHKQKSTEAKNIGTRVHEAIQNWLESGMKMQLDELDDDPEAQKGLKSFLEWGEQHEINIIMYEEEVSNGYSYAGRFDFLARIDGKMTLVDIKTSTGIFEPEMPLQVHAYADCLDMDVDHVAILRLDKHTGDIEYKAWDYNHKMTEAFAAMAEAYNILYPYKEPKKRGVKNGNND